LSIYVGYFSREGAEYDGAINGTASGIPLVLPQHTKSRLRTSSTGTPSIVRGIPSAVNTQIKLGDFVGVSNGNPLVTDACGQTPTNRIFNSGRTGSAYRTHSSGRFKNVTGSQIAGTWKATTSNTWTTMNLGTVCAAGDVIVMLVSTSGGTLYASLSSTLDSDGTGLNRSGSSGILPLQSGSIGLYISAASSSNFTFNEAKYDLELVSGSYVHRLLEGKVKLSKEVTV
jgi:hypothetical protein